MRKTMVKLIGKKAGFTLIELLVVIAIIAILAAILFPLFLTAKKRAQQASCNSNMHQIAIAFTMYADEWQGYMPDQSSVLSISRGHAYVGANYTNDIGGSWVTAYSHRFRSNPDSNGICQSPDGMGKVLYKYLKSDRVWRCPCDYLPDAYFPMATPEQIAQQRMYVSSYYYKHALSQCASYYMRPNSTSSVRYPSRVTMVYEFAWHGPYNDPRTYETTVYDGPTKRFSVIFFDCHLGSVVTKVQNAHYDMNWYWPSWDAVNEDPAQEYLQWDLSRGAYDR